MATLAFNELTQCHPVYEHLGLEHFIELLQVN